MDTAWGTGGGAGNDTYTYDSASFGTDLIEDNQGSDVLSLMGSELTNATYDANKMAWISGSGHEIRQYKLGAMTTLGISAAGDTQNTIFIHNWQAGQLGIQLSGEEEEAEKPQTQTSEVTTRADNNYVDFLSIGFATGHRLSHSAQEVAMHLVAAQASSTVATGRFDSRNTCKAGKKRRFQCRFGPSSPQSAHAYSMGLAGHKWLGRRMDAAQPASMGAQA